MEFFNLKVKEMKVKSKMKFMFKTQFLNASLKTLTNM